MAKINKNKQSKKLLRNTENALKECVILSVILYSLITYLRDMDILKEDQFIEDLKGADLTIYSKDIQYVIIQVRKINGTLKNMGLLYKKVGLQFGDRLLADIEKELGFGQFGLAYSNYIFGLMVLNNYIEYFHKPTFVITVSLSSLVEAYDLALLEGFESKETMRDIMADTDLARYFYNKIVEDGSIFKLKDFKRYKQLKKMKVSK